MRGSAWGEGRREVGKILELRAEAVRDLGVAAACLLAAFGMEGDETETEAEYLRRYVGALLIAGGLRDLTAIKRLLTAPEK